MSISVMSITAASVKETVFQVMVAALSAIGFYTILHGLLESLLVPRELATAIILTAAIPLEELDILLCEARRASVGRGRRLTLVVPKTLLREDPNQERRLLGAYTAIAEKYGATIRICEEEISP